MDQQTVELMILLQRGTHDAETWARIEEMLPAARTQLRDAANPAELTDLADLLEAWATAAQPPVAILAALQAASIAEDDLKQDERAIKLYQSCLERDRAEFEPWHRLEALLSRRGEHERLEAILKDQADAMRERSDIDRGLTANAYQRLGQLRSEHGRIDGAIEAYEQALEIAPDNETLAELATAYCSRGSYSDRRQAADLYCALGDILADEEGTAMLERALDLVPEHDEALDLLERAIPESEQLARLGKRWEAYLANSGNEAGMAARRQRLQRAVSAPESRIELRSNGASPESNGRGAPSSTPPAPEERDWNPKTLLGLGVTSLPPAPASQPPSFHPPPLDAPALHAAAAQAAAPQAASAQSSLMQTQLEVSPARFPPVPARSTDGFKVPPLFSGRPPAEEARDDEPSAEFDSEWPEQLALSESAPPRAPLLSSAPAYDDGDREDSPRLLDSSPPSYAFHAGTDAAKPARRGIGRAAALLAGAAVIGIAAGVAIASSLRAHSAASTNAVTATSAVGAAAPTSAVPAAVPPAAAPSAANEAASPTLEAAPTGATPTGEQNAAGDAPAAAPQPDGGEVKVAAKQLRVRGGLTAKEVATALEAGLVEIESCYDSALARKSTLRGTLRFTWAIDRAGKPSRLKKIGGTLKDATVERCSLDTIRDLQFPTSKKRPTHVIAPLAFQTRTTS